MSEPAIQVQHLSLSFGKKQVLNDISFSVNAGSFAVLAGPNGAGKTTLLRCLMGFYRPAQGTIELLGRPRKCLPGREVAFGAEACDFPSDWSLRQLARFRSLVGEVSAEAEREFERLLEQVKLSPSLKVFQLSRGQRSLAQLAWVLAPRPTLLLLDEPTLGLDVVARDLALDLLLGFLAEQPATVLLATQDLDLAERLADTVILLHQGRCHWTGTLEAIKTQYQVVTVPRGFAPPEQEAPLVRRDVLEGEQWVVPITTDHWKRWLEDRGISGRTPTLGEVAFSLWHEPKEDTCAS